MEENLKVYLAAAFHRKHEMAVVASELRAMGIEVTSRWLDDIIRPDTTSLDDFREQNAIMDAVDVLAAEKLIRFADNEEMSFPLVKSSLATGSRMFEFGLAWSNKKECITVGGHQCIFDWLPNIVHFDTIDQLKSYLQLCLDNERGAFAR